MPPSGLALALAAACIHAAWNLLLARSPNTQAAGVVVVWSGIVAFAPAAAWFWRVEPAAWKYIVASGFLELVYWSLLTAAYRRADLSVVYPVARGVAPVLVLVVGATLLGAGTSLAQGGGVFLVALGVFLVRGLRGHADRRGVVFGLAIASCTAGYTLVDKHGIVHANAIAYLEMDLLIAALGYGVAMTALSGFATIRREIRPSIVLAGLGMFSGYLLVLLALRLAPAAAVAAVRETSIVIATGFATLVLRERVGATRLAGAVLVAGGVALLGL